MAKFLLSIAEQGFIPDFFIKTAVRFITKKRLNEYLKEELQKKLMTPMSNIMKFHQDSSNMH
jgi:hypothetical protein